LDSTVPNEYNYADPNEPIPNNQKKSKGKLISMVFGGTILAMSVITVIVLYVTETFPFSMGKKYRKSSIKYTRISKTKLIFRILLAKGGMSR